MVVVGLDRADWAAAATAVVAAEEATVLNQAGWAVALAMEVLMAQVTAADVAHALAGWAA